MVSCIMLKNVISYHRMLVDDDLVRLLVAVGLVRVLVDVGSVKSIGRWRPYKKIPVDDGLASTSV